MQTTIVNFVCSGLISICLLYFLYHIICQIIIITFLLTSPDLNSLTTTLSHILLFNQAIETEHVNNYRSCISSSGLTHHNWKMFPLLSTPSSSGDNHWNNEQLQRVHLRRIPKKSLYLKYTGKAATLLLYRSNTTSENIFLSTWTHTIRRTQFVLNGL